MLNVGILAAPEIFFLLEDHFRCDSFWLAPGNYSVVKEEEAISLFRGEEFLLKGSELTLLPEKNESFFQLRQVTIGISFHWEQQEDQRFTGGLKFISEAGMVRAVNLVLLETYLRSVISSEMSATASPALLEAHAVISRSWLLAQMEKRRTLQKNPSPYCSSVEIPGEIIRWYDREDHSGFDVCADDHCQRYHGVTKIISEKAAGAVDATFGEALMVGDEICDARFSKCCGGISEAFEYAWEPAPKAYLSAIADSEPVGSRPPVDLRREAAAEAWIRSTPPAFCHTADRQILAQVLPGFDQQTTDFFRWKVTYTRAELAGLICRRSGIDFGEILRLEPVERGFSGRLVKLKIVGTKRTLTVGKELEIRRWLSPSHLYSSAFVVDYGREEGGVPEKIVLTGAGWGHGVGLCQIGAAVMGEKGFSYREILFHYFKGARLEKLYQKS